MNAEVPTVEKPANDQPAAPPLDLGVERTIMSADRTLMAWTRTAVALISFGFTIFKAFQYLPEDKKMPPHGPRNFALAFISLGILSLILAGLQNWRHVRLISGGRRRSTVNLSLIVAAILAGIGLFGIANIAFRVGPF